jgi:P2-related tail formation protein
LTYLFRGDEAAVGRVVEELGKQAEVIDWSQANEEVA